MKHIFFFVLFDDRPNFLFYITDIFFIYSLLHVAPILFINLKYHYFRLKKFLNILQI